MVTRFLPILLAVSLAPSVSFAEEAEHSSSNNAPVVDDARAPSSWVWADPATDLAADALAADNISKIIYINRCVGGCTIQPGLNDARINSSFIAKSTSVLTEFAHSQEVWDETIACIKDVYSPYDVQIVTEDPGTVFHHEAILAGSPQELGLSPQVGGIAPSACAPLNNVISFSFANHPTLGGDPEEMCWTVAQESAHAFGLPNHVFNCLDPMTYIREPCGRKFFRDASYPCGEYQAGPCNCSGSTQNSHIELRNVFGDGTAPPPPTVDILLPKADTTVSEGFSIFWEAQDPRLISHSELWLNGTKYEDLVGHDYSLRFQNYNTLAPNLPDGYIDVEVKAYNGLGSESIAKVRVLKGSPCESETTCFDFQECIEGHCRFPAPTAELGGTCDVDQNCLEGLCGSVGGEQLCSTSCNLNVTGACVDGFACVATGTGGVCWPKSDSGGCCSVAGSKGEPLPWFAMGIFLLGFVVLRRRRAQG